MEGLVRMNTLKIGRDQLLVPEIGLGCMRINGLEIDEAERLIQTALDNGINFFDHADIYGNTEAETFFARAVQRAGIARDRMILQSKCGIRKGFFDFSKDYVLRATDGILSRLNIDHLDVLLLHRPDALMEPTEVAEAFSRLKDAGKVRHFGVSNQNPGQIALLNKYLPEPVLINQMQLSIAHCVMMDAGLNVNMHNDAGIGRDGGILEYCRLHDITIQAWSPFQYGFFEGVFIDSPLYPELNRVMDEVAERYAVSKTVIAIAWILRHPARMQPIVGTTNRARLVDIGKASDIRLTREEWYALYCAAGKILP